MSQLESLIFAIEAAKRGKSSLDSAKSFLVAHEGERIGKVAPQERRLLALGLWNKPGYSSARIATALGITERHVRRIIAEGPTFGRSL
jgi:hypothetical protein